MSGHVQSKMLEKMGREIQHRGSREASRHAGDVGIFLKAVFFIYLHIVCFIHVVYIHWPTTG